MTVDDQLAMAAARLARAAPEEWERFLEAVSAFSSTQVTNCVKATLEELPRAQGRAQNAAQVYAVMANCLQSAEKLEGKRQ